MFSVARNHYEDCPYECNEEGMLLDEATGKLSRCPYCSKRRKGKFLYKDNYLESLQGTSKGSFYRITSEPHKLNETTEFSGLYIDVENPTSTYMVSTIQLSQIGKRGFYRLRSKKWGDKHVKRCQESL